MNTKAYDFKFQPIEVLNLLGLYVTDTGKVNAYFDCPFCHKSAKEKKFNVNLTNGYWHCYHCGKGEAKGGGILGLYAELTGKTNDKEGRSEAYKEINEKLYGNNREPTKVIPKQIIKPAVDYSPCGIEQRNAVYNELLNILKLSPVHKEKLLARGLTEELIDKNRYRTMPYVGHERIASMLIAKGLNLKGVPGFWNNNGHWTLIKNIQGYLIPVLDMAGRIQGLQIRLDNPTKSCKYQWLSSNFRKDGAKANTWAAYVGNVITKTAFLIEGPLKAQVVSCLSNKNMYLIAVPGVGNLYYFNEALEFLKSNGVEEVVNLYDMDKFEKPQVLKAMLKANSMIKAHGLSIANYRWNPKYKGYDDFLLAKRQGKI